MNRVWLLGVPLMGLMSLGCGHSQSTQGEPAIERWETLQEWTLVSKERCVTGPFAIEVPAREVEFGRRFVVDVFGERTLPMDTRRTVGNTSYTGWGWSENDNERVTHAGCRGHDTAGDNPGGANPDGTPPGDPPAGGRPPAGGTPPPTGGTPPPTDGAPPPTFTTAGAKESWELTLRRTQETLFEFEGSLPGFQQAYALAWFPQGRPHYHNLDSITTTYYSRESGDASFRFEFWFHRPVDLQNVVIRFRDEIMVPTGSLATYRANFAARVATEEQRYELAKARGEITVVDSSNDPDAAARGKVPPPPKNEIVPPVPGENVMWLSGYWQFETELDGFVWISGTYVVDATPKPLPAGTETASVPPPKLPEPTQPAPAPAVTPPEPPEKPREIAQQIAACPPPKQEVIPPPPQVTGAVWVTGYWELKGLVWTWVNGRWQVSNKGMRFRTPSVEVRGNVKFYVPGGWIKFGKR